MKKSLQQVLGIFAVIAITAVCVQAQINMPAPSPKGTVSQIVGLTEIEIEYSRPGVKDREIFGDLVPYGETWRTGANESTKISFSDEVTVEDNKLAAGTYALYTVPGQEEWTIIISNNTELWGSTGYNEADDAARFKVTPETLPFQIETFTIQIEGITNTSAEVSLMWDKTKVSFTVETEIDSKVMADIDRYVNNMERTNSGLYYQAASYYYEADKDLDQALTWINKALEARDDAFWYAHLKAKILAKKENYQEAIAAAEKSKEMAKAANNNDYVRLNEKAIAKWKEMK